MTLNTGKRRIGKRVRVVACWMLCVTACRLSMATAAQSATQTKPAGEQTAKPENQGNSNLTREVRHQLAELPFYSEFDYITFTLNGRKVTLSGQVVQPSLKKHAVAAIHSLEDVEAVIDQIEVLPRSTEDNELRRATYRAIYEDPTLATYAVQAVPSIHIIVKNGSVTLEGTVKSASDKNLAGIRAGNAQNAGTITNNLKIVQPNERAAE